MLTSFKYRNSVIVPSEETNLVAGGNGTGKSVMFTGIYQFLLNGQSDLISDVFLKKPFNDIKSYFIRQDDLICSKTQIVNKIKEITQYNLIKENIHISLKNIETDDIDESSYKLRIINSKVQSNIENFRTFQKLLKEKEKYENYLKSKEGQKLCNRIIEIQDQISREEVVVDNFEKNIAILQKEKLEKEISDLKHQLENEYDLLERKKILWREEAKIKESLKKHRNDRRVIDLIEFDQSLTDAVISVLGNRLKAKVVQFEDEALNEIETLKFRQTYLILEKIQIKEDLKEQTINTGLIPMRRLIKTKIEFNRLKEYLFKDIYIVENIADSYEQERNKIFVTLEGQVLHKNGAITGGYEENKELKYLIKEKEVYRQGVQRLKEIEKEIKRVTDSSTKDTKDLINKIISEKEMELKDITISGDNINYNLEKLKIMLRRLIDQKKTLNMTDSGFQMDQDLEQKNLYEELGRINKKVKTIMINKNIDYEDIATRVDELIKQESNLREQKNKIAQIAKELSDENESSLKSNMKQISDRILYFYNKINGTNYVNERDSCDKTSSYDSKSSSPISFPSCDEHDDLKENFRNIQIKSQIFDEPNALIRNITTLSGGQLQMLTLSLMFALDEIVNFDIILLDEVDSNLDESKLQNIQELIINMKAQTFQISHKRNICNFSKCFWITTEHIDEISNDEVQNRLI